MDIIQDGLFVILGLLALLVLYGLYCLWQQSKGRNVRGSWLFVKANQPGGGCPPQEDDFFDQSEMDASPAVNTNGLPMIRGSGIDVGGNVYGAATDGSFHF